MNRNPLRREVWKICGAALLALTILGIFVNNTMPPPHESRERYMHLWVGIVFLAGCLTAVRNRDASSSWAAAKAALLGYIPEMIALALWAAGIFHPLVTKADGPFPLLESRLALYDVMFPTAPRPGFPIIPFAAAVLLVCACAIGFLGGVVGRMISRFVARDAR